MSSASAVEVRSWVERSRRSLRRQGQQPRRGRDHPPQRTRGDADQRSPARQSQPAQPAPRAQGDAGQVAGIEALPFGVLVFVVGALLAANAWAVVDVRFAVAAAAREAVRAYVEAPDPMAAAALAERAARNTVSGHGRNPERIWLSITSPSGRGWGRCGRVEITARYPVPAITLPGLGGYGEAFEAVATHSELIDPYRAGLPGSASC